MGDLRNLSMRGRWTEGGPTDMASSGSLTLARHLPGARACGARARAVLRSEGSDQWQLRKINAAR